MAQSEKIGIFFGSTMGNTRECAQKLAELLGKERCFLHDMATTPLSKLKDYTILLIGSSTWQGGQLQDDWKKHEQALNFALPDMSKKKIAFFGFGDQAGYPNSFADALGILYQAFFGHAKPTLVGRWPRAGYNFNGSKALINGSFVGLVLDMQNQDALSESRINTWVKQLKLEL